MISLAIRNKRNEFYDRFEASWDRKSQDMYHTITTENSEETGCIRSLRDTYV